MGICTGTEFLSRLRDDREVWIEGQRVKDVTEHPSLRRGAASMARLLDRQHDVELSQALTYTDPGSDERFAMAFLQPHSIADVGRRGAALYDWPKWSNGMLGRTPDYLNSSFMAFAGAADYFAQCRPKFAENVRNYYEKMRREDLVLTHTLVNPQVNRHLTGQGLASPEVALRVINETDAGLIVNGARMLATLGPCPTKSPYFLRPYSRPHPR